MEILDLPLNFQARIEVSGECWLWTGAKRNGYGIVFVGYGKPRNGKTGAAICRYAHREIYQLYLCQKLKRGLDCDHQCHNKLCVNPAHIRILPRSEHLKRHCAERFPPEDRAAAKARRQAQTVAWLAAHPERRREHWKRSEAKRQALKTQARKIAREAYPDLPFKSPERYGVFLSEYRRLRDENRTYPKRQPAKLRSQPKTGDRSTWKKPDTNGYVS